MHVLRSLRRHYSLYLNNEQSRQREREREREYQPQKRSLASLRPSLRAIKHVENWGLIAPLKRAQARVKNGIAETNEQIVLVKKSATLNQKATNS